MDSLCNAVETRRAELLGLLQRLIEIPSPTLHEGALACYVEKEFSTIGLRTDINALGDVTGFTHGKYNKPDLLILNTHLDQAEAGDMPDPFSGKRMDGAAFGVEGEVIFGRGANGQKACLAAMILAAKIILEEGAPLQRGFALNVGVLEECGGHISPQFLVEIQKVPIYAVVCGEHTNLKPVNIQRGMGHIALKIVGKGAHAAAPQNSSSAIIGLAKAILAIETLCRELPKDSTYGDALVSLNKIRISPNVVNAIPDIAEGVIDIRYPFTLKKEKIVALVQQKVDQALSSQSGLSYTVEVIKQPVRTYTGLEVKTDGGMLPFYTAPDHPLVTTLQDCIEEVSGRRPNPEIWSISSEAGYFSSVAGIPVVCYGPGEDRYTHNNLEHVKVEDVVTTAKVYARLIHKLCQS